MVLDPAGAGTAGGIVAGILATAKGAATAAKAIAKARHKGDLQLVGRLDDVREIKEIRGTTEAEHLGEYANSNDERRWIRMGIYMRRHFQDRDRIYTVKEKLRRSGGPQAVAISQAVQCGGFNVLVAWAQQQHTEAQAKRVVKQFLDYADRDSYFVQAHEDPNEVARDVTRRLQMAAPQCFLLAGSGDAAFICRITFARMSHAYPGYEAERFERRHEYRVLFYRD